GYLERVAEPALEHDPLHLLDVVRKVVSQLPDSAELLDLMGRAGRQSHDHSAEVEALSKQAGLAVKREDYPRAKQLYDELVSLDPHSPEFTQRLNKVRQLLGEPGLAEAPVAEEAPAFEIPPPAEIELDEETQAFVNSTLTDIDLFSSYGMADKAIELAKELIARVPHHIVGHEKLLDLYIGNGNDSGVVEVAGRLEPLLRQAGNRPRADEVMSLARRYAEKAGIAVPGRAPSAPPAPAPAPAAATFEIPTAAPAEPAFEIPATPATQEVDLSTEWATAAGGEAAPAFNTEDATAEIDFYLSQGLADEARQALARYETAFPGEPALAELASRIEAAGAPAAEIPIAEEGVSEIELPAMAEEPTIAEIPLEPAATEPEPAAAVEPEAAPVAADDGDTYDIVLEEQPKEAAPAASAAGLSAADFFSDLAGELDQALETAKTPAAPAKAAALPPAAKAAPPPPAAAGPQPPVGVLAEVFEEFKEEMGATEEVEDTESHYNLGIAYKEMGLLDEAVSEFQKVAKAAEKQKTHSQLFQACTLLGVCFMDKGMPQIAVRWYERALNTPGVDEEGALALRYDLGLAHEQAGNRKAALECFMEVYGANVDYRDVGDRIRELRGA
ncbi:MAG: tetratricopeptide repeat protein, partial [Candidatus Acidiferrales bacterium]